MHAIGFRAFLDEITTIFPPSIDTFLFWVSAIALVISCIRDVPRGIRDYHRNQAEKAREKAHNVFVTSSGTWPIKEWMLEEGFKNHCLLKAEKKRYRDEDGGEFFLDYLIEYHEYHLQSTYILRDLSFPEWLIEAKLELQDEEEGWKDQDPNLTLLLYGYPTEL